MRIWPSNMYIKLHDCSGVDFRVGVDSGAHPCWPITIIAVNVHHYKYSILKREIKRWLNTNKKHSNFSKELILSYT